MSDPYDLHRRRGWWTVSRHFAEDWQNALRLIQQQDILIQDIQHDWATGAIKFYAIGAAFDVVPPGTIVPQYRPHVDLIENTVSWKRTDDHCAEPTVRAHEGRRGFNDVQLRAAANG